MDGLIVNVGMSGRFFPKAVVGGAEISAKCKASCGKDATIFVAEKDFGKIVIIRRGYNARTPATISGPAVAWFYADGHGMELVAVLRRGAEFKLWLPGHHSKGPGTRYTGRVTEEGKIELKQLPTAKRLEL